MCHGQVSINTEIDSLAVKNIERLIRESMYIYTSQICRVDAYQLGYKHTVFINIKHKITIQLHNLYHS